MHNQLYDNEYEIIVSILVLIVSILDMIRVMKLRILLPTLLLLAACNTTSPLQGDESSSSATNFIEGTYSALDSVQVTPISHATMMLQMDDHVIVTDPVGGPELFADMVQADIIVVTDIHGDHFDAETLAGAAAGTTRIVAPQAVYDQLPESLQAQTTVIANGETIDIDGIAIEAIPMYNLPEADDSRHTKGRGNGYVLAHDGTRIYISGDTSGIPEMRALQDIDIAFVCMNLPYTMDPIEAADAVLAFAPHQVFPYHYRQPDGFADVELFASIISENNPAIQVVQLQWYPE